MDTSAWLTGKVSEVASRPGLAGDRDAAQDHARAAAWSLRRPAILSPATVLARALEVAAGTDAERHSAFRAAYAAYRRDLRAFFEPHILAQALDPAPVCQGCPARPDFPAYDAVPAFVPSVPRAAAKHQAVVALGCLIAGTLLLAALAYRRLSGWPA